MEPQNVMSSKIGIVRSPIKEEFDEEDTNYQGTPSLPNQIKRFGYEGTNKPYNYEIKQDRENPLIEVPKFDLGNVETPSS
jgi:hypothetical protein